MSIVPESFLFTIHPQTISKLWFSNVSGFFSLFYSLHIWRATGQGYLKALSSLQRCDMGLSTGNKDPLQILASHCSIESIYTNHSLSETTLPFWLPNQFMRRPLCMYLALTQHRGTVRVLDMKAWSSDGRGRGSQVITVMATWQFL